MAVDSFASAAPATFHPRSPHEAVANTLSGSGACSFAKSGHCGRAISTPKKLVRSTRPASQNDGLTHVGHTPGMEIDATVESVLAAVEAHTWSSLGMGLAPEPASWLAGTPCLKIPRWAEARP